MLIIVAATEDELRGAKNLHGCEQLICGVGPIAAACSLASRLACDPTPFAILHVGIAGARRGSGIEPLDIVLGSTSIYCDSQSAWVERELAPNQQLLLWLRQALPDAKVKAIGTSADVGTSSNCDVEAMEGFSVLMAAKRFSIPAIEVRVISNEIEQDDRGEWHIEKAFNKLEELTPLMAHAIVSAHNDQ